MRIGYEILSLNLICRIRVNITWRMLGSFGKMIEYCKSVREENGERNAVGVQKFEGNESGKGIPLGRDFRLGRERNG